MAQHLESPAGSPATRYPKASPWVGWIGFAGVIMVMLGSLHIFEGLIALFKDEYFVVAPSGLTVNVDFTTWGWAHLIGGVIVLLAGFGVLAGQVWARTLGVILALISVLVNVAFLAAYPLWSLIMIALAVVVIMALSVHGSDIKPGA